MGIDIATSAARAASFSVPRDGVGNENLEAAISAATSALLALQRDDGHFVFELEADATIPAEYVLMRHYLGEPVDAAGSKDRQLPSPHSVARTAAGRCSMTAHRTSAPASRPITP